MLKALQKNVRFGDFLKQTIRNMSRITFKQEKAKFLNMPLEEKRKLYGVGAKFTTLSDIITWPEYYETKKVPKYKEYERFKANHDFNKKISIFAGDITGLEIDMIVNAANKKLQGGGGVDGAIHRAAGSDLMEECQSFLGCQTGQAVLTGGYKLPAKYVIHTVGPVGEKPDQLKECYQNSFKHLLEQNMKSIAFPCISTGIYGYPALAAANVALETTRLWMEQHADAVERIIFCLFTPEDISIYQYILQEYFPLK